MKPDLFWIPGPWRGRLAIAARPRGGDWLEDEARDWHSAGIDELVSLLESEEAAQLGLDQERLAVEANGMRFTSFPIPDRGVPHSMEAAVTLLREIAERLTEGKRIAIHCRQGIGRSGVVASGVLVAGGMTPDAALDAVRSARGILIPETEEQRQWVRCLLPEHMFAASREA